MNANEFLNQPYQWISSDAQLAASVDKLELAGWIIVDTEFVRVNTFFPKPGVIQLYDGKSVLLIDPLAISDWSPLASLFENTGIEKVLHACSEDLELFHQLALPQPIPLFDTQVAAAMLGKGLNEGLQRLVGEVLGVDLVKHSTRSDWTQRPLSEQQIEYACEDVAALAPLYEALRAQVVDQGKIANVIAEGRMATEAAAGAYRPELYYLRLRGGWKLKPLEQRRLAQIARWREDKARELDVPRRRICSDEDLIAIAQYGPTSLGDLTRVTSIQGSALRKYGKLLIDIVKLEQKDVSSEELAAPSNLTTDDFKLIRPPLPRHIKPLYQAVKKEALQVAAAQGVNPGLLASRGMLEELVHWYITGQQEDHPQVLQGWRGDWLKPVLLTVLENQQGVISTDSSS